MGVITTEKALLIAGIILPLVFIGLRLALMLKLSHVL